MTRAEARKDKDFTFGENIQHNHSMWINIKKELEANGYKLPKTQFLSTQRGSKVVSTLIIRSDKERELPFHIPQEAIGAEISPCEKSIWDSGVFEWTKNFPQRLSNEYLFFLMINDDAINNFTIDKEIEEKHSINKQLYFK